MIYSYDLDKKDREVYLRYIIKLLNKKYFVQQSKIGLAVGIDGNYLRDFTSGRKGMPIRNLDTLEEFLSDLYEGLLLYEIPQGEKDFKSFLRELPDTLEYQNLIHGV